MKVFGTEAFLNLSFAVNLKKDSENTPVKGGTMADLGRFLHVVVNVKGEI